MKILRIVVPMILLACATTEDPKDGEDPVDETLTWEEMDFSERQAFMVSDVMPVMQQLFEDYDSSRYSEITCATCHGEGATDGTFSMPSDSLFPIDFNNFPVGPGADFMSNSVVPEMAELLDMEPFDPATGQGFGCLGCHPAG